MHLIWVLQSQIGHESKRWPCYVNPHSCFGWAESAGNVCSLSVCGALLLACWRVTWCCGFALSFLLPIWHFFDHSVRKLWILFPVAFPAQIKGRICSLGFASLHGGLSVSLCYNLQPAVAFLRLCLGSNGWEKLLVLRFTVSQGSLQWGGHAHKVNNDK